MPPCPSFSGIAPSVLAIVDLLLVGDVESAEEDDAALFEVARMFSRLAAAEQRVEVGSDLAADSRGEIDDVQLCGGESHADQLTLVRMVLAECFTRGCFHSSTASETVISE